MLALHGFFTIETVVQFCLLAVVSGYLVDGLHHQLASIFGHHQHLAQLNGYGLHPNLQGLTSKLHLLQTIADVRHRDGLRLTFTLQGEEAVFVGHYRQLIHRNAGADHGLIGLGMDHGTADHCSLSPSL